MGCVAAVQEQGLRIPDDLGILAFDDYPFSQFVDPQLTVVDINVRDLGNQAAKSLMDIIRHPNMQIQTYVEPTSMTVGEWLDIWLKEYTVNIRPATKGAYEEHVRVHLKPYLGKIKLNQLAPHQIQQAYNELLRARGLSAKSVKNIHGVLHRALERATASFTLSTYAHATPGMKRESANRMNQFIHNLTESH